MSEDIPDVVKALSMQGGICRGMGSPLNAELLERAAADWLAGGPVRALLAPWASLSLKAQFEAAVPLRLIGSWHELALSGDDPAVTRAYEQLDAGAIWDAVVPAMTAQRDRLAAFMTHEVRRSICLLGGFLEIAKATGLPLRCFELAASAGLNLSWDRYRYQVGEDHWGDPKAAVQLDTDWSGPSPPVDAVVKAVARGACDRRPTDLRDPDQRRRLISYIWADQSERLARIQAAIDVALAAGVVVAQADAVVWARREVALEDGAATVLYHSVFWTYMTPESQAALLAEIEAKAKYATAEAPFAWLRMEPQPGNMAAMDVRLTLWPGGEKRLLAETPPHGATVRWMAG
jgi:hypothetical protein